MHLVLDTNIFVAAGFNPGSHSAQLLELVQDGELTLLWDDATRRETKAILRQIPPLDWAEVAGLFKPEFRVPRSETPPDLADIEDPEDRKFADLAQRTDAVLVSNDDHLLAARESLGITILTPRQCVAHMREGPPS